MSVQVIVGGAGVLKAVEEALKRAPQLVLQAVDGAAGRGAQEVARKAKQLAPKADSTLTNSILARRITLGSWMTSANARHAGALEGGTRAGGRPPVQTLLAWIQRKSISPRTPGMSMEDLAHLIRRKIVRRGTRAQPYLRPALESMRPRIAQLLGTAVQTGLQQAFQT